MDIGQKFVRLAAASAAVPLALLWTSPAHAETNPSCGRVTPIGETGHIVIGGETFASVKQFKGCGKNWAYGYVWQSWRSNHRSWEMCVSIATGRSAPYSLEDLNCNSNKVELWSSGADTLTQCTHAVGYWPDRATGRTDIRC